jgi:hypothetical protein
MHREFLPIVYIFSFQHSNRYILSLCGIHYMFALIFSIIQLHVMFPLWVDFQILLSKFKIWDDQNILNHLQ